MTAGLRDKQVLQRCPHMVLADKRYYHAALKEPLARWALLWLSAQQKLAYDGIEDTLLLGYLLHGKHHRDRNGVIRLNRRLKDDHMKLLNLCHDWLATFLPHTHVYDCLPSTVCR